MVSIDEMEELLDEITQELPEEFFKELNGGILLLPQKKMHQKSVDDDLYILGEYHRDRNLGRYIAIYYGSFMKIHKSLSKDQLKKKLEHTIKHEFRHHLESLAGERGLEIEDKKNINNYLNKKNKK